ncbi:MAG: beta-propeller domain-containing protein [Acidimicrobiales bacterium]|nr:beta-propeller domain-containing protein [Acidimicrobiales bacterium]HRW36192.1 beta-propeller domain-containing protein [Aquihabitans sp.]
MDDDPKLSAAGARLRQQTPTLDPARIELAALRRRSRRAVGAALVAIVLLGAVGAVALTRDPGEGDTASPRQLPPRTSDVEKVLAGLGSQPVDPTKVRLVSSVSRFGDCSALIGDLRKVGAAHVGSQGFGAWGVGPLWSGRLSGFAYAESSRSMPDVGPVGGDDALDLTPYAPTGDTIGTNVQVVGVDELDSVKAEGVLIYDLDGDGNLRITDSRDGTVLSSLDVTPRHGEPDEHPEPSASQILVADGKVAVFGNEEEVAEPVEGDPSATRASTSYLTVTLVDAGDPAKPAITDRVRIEGGLVSARLVDGEIRLVTTSNMADLGFVMPTTPNSVPIALEQNRRTVATSTEADWIPDWQRDGGDPTPLVPCDRVYVPDTFAGVAMTSMVTFPMGTGSFEPKGTSIVAPGTTLYAGLDTVAISSEVWVDPIDRERLEFDDWKTAIHRFGFADDAAPAYEGSGVVEGSTVGQFAFGEVGDALGVVTTSGTPWSQDPEVGVDLTLLTADGEGTLAETATVDDLSDGRGAVTAVRFLDDRVLVSTGFFGRQTIVLDLSDPAAPRRAGGVVLPGEVGYFHPLPDHRALLVGSRSDTVGSGQSERTRQWVQVHLLDVSDVDAPKVLATWERPWSADDVGADHHAFTYWPSRNLALWGLRDTQDGRQPNHVAVLSTDGGLTEVAVPTVSEAPEVAPPCTPIDVSAEVRQLVGSDGVVLRCDDRSTKEVTWPRYECFRVDDATVARYAPGEEERGAWFACSLTPKPHASRVLVVDGAPILYTDQTLERLDPETFASTQVTYHPNRGIGW